MYNPRRRKCYSKKYYRNRLFAPSLTKANMPNYYQMKGRIIQQSPARIKEPPTQMITREILDKYYRKLVEYKYPGINPSPTPPPPFDPSNYIFYIHTENVSSIRLPGQINLEYLYNNYVQQAIAGLPSAPTGYSYVFDLVSINFVRAGVTSDDTGNYSYTWNSNLFTAPIAIIQKTQTCTQRAGGDFLIFAVPASGLNIKYSRVTFTNSSIQYTIGSTVSTDEVHSDDGFYPLISSNELQETYNATIDIGGTNISNHTIAFNIMIYLFSNDF